MKSLPSALSQRVKGKEQELYRLNKSIKGRQIAWMIYDWFKTDVHMNLVYGFQDLVSMTWWGDAKMEGWLHQWDHIVSNLENPLDDKTLRDIMEGHLNTSAELKEDIAHYNRVG